MFYHHKGVFSEDLCNTLISSVDKSLLHESRIEAGNNTRIRSSLSCGLHALPSGFEAILHGFIESNPYNLTLSPEPYQYAEYRVGDHYTWHTDLISRMKRHVSISVVLNDGYIGGEFEYISEDRSAVCVSMGVGDLVMFPSWYRHRIRPVSSGKRISLVGWYG